MRPTPSPRTNLVASGPDPSYSKDQSNRDARQGYVMRELAPFRTTPCFDAVLWTEMREILARTRGCWCAAEVRRLSERRRMPSVNCT